MWLPDHNHRKLVDLVQHGIDFCEAQLVQSEALQLKGDPITKHLDGSMETRVTIPEKFVPNLQEDFKEI